jgi:ATP-dependent DNA helicase RecG
MMQEAATYFSVWNRPLNQGCFLNEKQAAILLKDLELFTLGDLLKHFPFRYEDRSLILPIRDLQVAEGQPVQIVGTLESLDFAGQGKSRRLCGKFRDTGSAIEAVWFQKPDLIARYLQPGLRYLVYGRLSEFNGKLNFTHPELELYRPEVPRPAMEPVYSSSEKMKRFGLDSKALNRLILRNIEARKAELKEPFSSSFCEKYQLMPLDRAFLEVHRPSGKVTLDKALERLKTEELFPLQFFLQKKRLTEKISRQGFPMPRLALFNEFYQNHLPFPLTNAQKRVLKEIRTDLISGEQMNRLVQGDVGSGKTIVAFLSMLMAKDNGYQSCLMAPTEILANQHFRGISELAEPIGLKVGLLTGSTRTAARRQLAAGLEDGSTSLLIGTHALIEDHVRFHNLGMAVIDEQHRFGVAQRAALQSKTRNGIFPHILLMTATPIPRTLAMALYSDLDISAIDEMPAGRREIQTAHRFESQRMRVFGFIREQVLQGRQVYVVYPLIEESESLDLTNLMEGFESFSRAFPEFPLSMVHGKMKAADKDIEMARFVKGETKIMVATTVIEVGVNVPNASIMVIENAERFGLTQMHQLRGRVGRGEYQSYCILMTGHKLGRDARTRIETMCRSSSGFEISETDLKLRGPGDLMGTRQSGLADLKLTNLAEDGHLLEKVRNWVREFLLLDPDLKSEENQILKTHLEVILKVKAYWNEIA